MAQSNTASVSGAVYAKFPASSQPLVTSAKLNESVSLCAFTTASSSIFAMTTKFALSNPSAQLIETFQLNSRDVRTVDVQNLAQIVVKPNGSAAYTGWASSILTLPTNAHNPVSFSQVHCSLFAEQVDSRQAQMVIEASFPQLIGPGEHMVNVASWTNDLNIPGSCCASLWADNYPFDITLQFSNNFVNLRLLNMMQDNFLCVNIPGDQQNTPCQLFVSNPSLDAPVGLNIVMVYLRVAESGSDGGFWERRGAIAGVAIGCSSVVVLLLIFCYVRRRCARRSSSDDPAPEGHAHVDGGAYASLNIQGSNR